ncbi:hypothetical protein VTK73DRAFT_9750 [Phialemonium thermophilum]|uniref:VHS domain-containing protein n=1 Tax=Phialemonium thermophilum TaxID=223376 RepID=A0ABR3W0D5_9PEZI
MFSQKKPYSAVTVTIENLTSETYEEDDLSGIPDLVEVIKLQASGPAEAARALRKKLKYGNVHRQLRALTLLDGLIQNAGPRFQRTFVDEPLLERLRVCGTSDLSDPDVRKKCSELFRSWAAEYKNTPGLERVARLYKVCSDSPRDYSRSTSFDLAGTEGKPTYTKPSPRNCPRRKQVVTQERSKVLKETENPFGDEEDEAQATGSSSQQPPPPSSSSSGRLTQTRTSPLSGNTITGHVQSFSHVEKESRKKKDKKGKKSRPFVLEAEKEQMKVTIAESSIAATNLLNTLQSINREKERISENPVALQHFDACKVLRRKILRYIYHVESEQWLGSLLHANDELVTALMTFEQLDRSIDADSDSDDDVAEQAHLYRMATERAAKGKDPASPTADDFSSSPPPTSGIANLNISGGRPPSPPAPPRPPRPSALSKPPLPASPRPAPAENESDGGENVDDEDENDPFADRNAVVTPKVERGEPRW